MKKFIYPVVLLMAGFVFAQDLPLSKSPYGTLNITTGVVAPGCESIDAKKINELNNCLSQFLQTRLAAELDYFTEWMNEVNSGETRTKIQFNINREGRLTDIALSKGELKSDFSDAVIKALGKISEEVIFQPAAYSNGVPSKLSIALPVIMILESDEADSNSDGEE